MLVGVQNASAQITEPVEFTTAFPFTVGHATVPAGSYTIKPNDDSPDYLELTGGRTAVFFQTQVTQAADTPSKTEVVFKRDGNGYVLKDIWLEGSHAGAETMSAEGERHVAKNPGPVSEQRVAARKESAATNNRASNNR